MAISPIQAADVLRMANGSETSGAASNQEVEAFMQHLLAGGSAVPEHAVVNHLQQAQQTLISGLRDTSLLKQLSPENALLAQQQLAGSVVGVDVVAKIAGSFTLAVNKLVSMQ